MWNRLRFLTFTSQHGRSTIRRPDRRSSAENADDLQSVAADNGFQDWHTEYEIAAYDVEYLVHYRGSSPKAALNNALNRANGYSQCWMAETSYSTAERSYGVAEQVGWYRQFREIVLMFAITNTESLCEPL